MKNNFVKTSDEKMADKLIENRFTFICKQNGIYTFINDGKLLFSDDEKKKLIYTDILAI